MLINKSRHHPCRSPKQISLGVGIERQPRGTTGDDVLVICSKKLLFLVKPEDIIIIAYLIIFPAIGKKSSREVELGTSKFAFADDTNIFYSNSNIRTLTKTVNEELKNVSDWLKANKHSLSIKKTQLLIFKTKNKKINQQVNITLNNANK